MQVLYVCVNCDVFAVDWEEIPVYSAEKTSIVIAYLEPHEEYCVKMRSVSFIGDSHFTAPLQRRVFQTGNNVVLLTGSSV